MQNRLIRSTNQFFFRNRQAEKTDRLTFGHIDRGTDGHSVKWKDNLARPLLTKNLKKIQIKNYSHNSHFVIYKISQANLFGKIKKNSSPQNFL